MILAARRDAAQEADGTRSKLCAGAALNGQLACVPGGKWIPVDPLDYGDWDGSFAAQTDASFFHTAAWARVLHETYGHTPFYFYWRANGERKALLPVMEVNSAWTGRRGVSLPFTDFCVPLALKGLDGAMGKSEFSEGVPPGCFDAALDHGRRRGWRYLECRGIGNSWHGASASLSFLGHVIDLTPDTEALFKGLEGAVRRGIRKAESAGVKVRFENDLEGIRTFYDLHCKTRIKHGLPPQPFRFFENIAREVLARGLGFVAVARHEQTPIAASVFFHFGREAIYKFGASDMAFQQLRPNNLLMWESIKRCAAAGCGHLHLGRTSMGNEGLRRFKLGFGAREEEIDYFKFDFRKNAFVTDTDRAENWANSIFRLLPLPLLRLAGRALYPHLS